MREKVQATRYNDNASKPWNLTIQLTRTELIWDMDEGFIMSGTWQGQLPQNGLYKFARWSSIDDPRLSAGNDLLGNTPTYMIITFHPSGEWDAVDFMYKCTFPAFLISSKDEVRFTGHGYGWIPTQLFGSQPAWFGVSITHNLTDTVSREFKFTERAYISDLLNIRNDDVGFIASFGGTFFSGIDIINPEELDGTLRQLSPVALSSSSIEQAGVLDRKVLGIEYNKDTNQWNSLAIRNGSLVKRTAITLPKPDPNKLSVLTAGTSANNSAPNFEGQLVDYLDGIEQVQTAIPNITIADIIHPMTGLRANYDTENMYVGVGYFPKRVDFYKSITELKGFFMQNYYS